MGIDNPKCSFCDKEAIDSMSFEGGNNAEYSVEMDMCQEHIEEQEKTCYKFEEKYGQVIEDAINDKLTTCPDPD